jgi:hypothetical protein
VIEDQESSKNERSGLAKTDVIHVALKDMLDYINRLPNRGGPCLADAMEVIKRIDADIFELSRIVRHLENLAYPIER